MFIVSKTQSICSEPRILSPCWSGASEQTALSSQQSNLYHQHVKKKTFLHAVIVVKASEFNKCCLDIINLFV